MLVEISTRSAAQVVSVDRTPYDLVAYNLSVEEYHTYYVGEQGLLVHNAKCSSGLDNVTGAESKADTLQPGPYAKESIPAHRGKPTAAEQRQVNELMEKHGCHTCGTKNAGTKSGNAVADHQPPQALDDPKEFFPHCVNCARRQGGQVRQQKLKRGE